MKYGPCLFQVSLNLKVRASVLCKSKSLFSPENESATEKDSKKVYMKQNNEKQSKESMKIPISKINVTKEKGNSDAKT